MTNTLINFAFFCLCYNFLYITISLFKMAYDWYVYRPPLSYLEVWLLMDSKFEEMQKVIEEENQETRQKMVDSLWNSEERSLEHIKEELKRLKK